MNQRTRLVVVSDFCADVVAVSPRRLSYKCPVLSSTSQNQNSPSEKKKKKRKFTFFSTQKVAMLKNKKKKKKGVLR